MALCHNGTLGRLESLCCSMQLAFEQYVANKMGMMKIMRMVNVVVAVKMIMGKMMMMMMVMANMMMSEWTRDLVLLFIVIMLGRLEPLCFSMQLTFEQYVANKMGLMKVMRMIIVIMIMMMATKMMSEMTRDQCDDPLWMELH